MEKILKVNWENLGSYFPQIDGIAFKLSTMVGENFESYLPQMARIAFKLHTMIGFIDGKAWSIDKENEQINYT